jgi:Ca-activated chloride channel family protein
MAGSRLKSLKQALTNLAGADDSTTGTFAQFRSRERVTLLPFSSTTQTPVVVDVPETDKTSALEQIRDVANGLHADGGTAIYDSLEEAYTIAQQQRAERPDTFVSIVLMTDGENTDGDTIDDFDSYYKSLGSAASAIPTFVVLFGDGNVDELQSVAKLTGGQSFDALNGNLASAFQEIRGYQ